MEAMQSALKERISTTTLCTVLVAVSTALSVYIGQPWRWFSWHPLLMMLAFVGTACAGIVAKRKGGRKNTIDHAWLMSASAALSLGGWYVIYQQKIMLGKPHNTSYHS